jgi:hypothetical protein
MKLKEFTFLEIEPNFKNIKDICHFCFNEKEAKENHFFFEEGDVLIVQDSTCVSFEFGESDLSHFVIVKTKDNQIKFVLKSDFDFLVEV